MVVDLGGVRIKQKCIFCIVAKLNQYYYMIFSNFKNLIEAM